MNFFNAKSIYFSVFFLSLLLRLLTPIEITSNGKFNNCYLVFLFCSAIYIYLWWFCLKNHPVFFSTRLAYHCHVLSMNAQMCFGLSALSERWWRFLCVFSPSRSKKRNNCLTWQGKNRKKNMKRIQYNEYGQKTSYKLMLYDI